MSSNNIGKNISNAFSVVNETYKNVDKLLSFLQSQASERGEYICVTPNFLRWRSDVEYYGWLLKVFILAFQSVQDTPLDNGYRNGPLYIASISFLEYDEPMIDVARFDYANIPSWSSGYITRGEGWRFDQPLYRDVTDMDDGSPYDGKVKNIAKADKDYWGIRRVRGFTLPLMDITTENAYAKVFGGFDALREKER